LNFSNDTNYPTDDAPLSLMPPEQLPPPETLTKPSFWRGLGSMLRELVETLILTLVIFLLIRFAVQNFRIEGYSMEPNFHDGQFLFVNKLVYMLGKPERGDVIVFVPPTSASRDYIKRVIGLPGDKVEIINGTVYINDQVLNEAYPLNPATYSMPPLIVPPDEYFVLGDNRNFSSDSHSWGTVHASKIIGRAWISYWPPQLIGFVPTYSYAANK
jgi:signal peptidase I